MKRIELIQPYKILSSNTTKLTKMDDNDKFIFIKLNFHNIKFML